MTNPSPNARAYVDKAAIGRRYSCHPNSTPRRVRLGAFPPPTLWLGARSPRWAEAALDRWDELLAATGDAREATRLLQEEQRKNRVDAP